MPDLEQPRPRDTSLEWQEAKADSEDEGEGNGLTVSLAQGVSGPVQTRIFAVVPVAAPRDSDGATYNDEISVETIGGSAAKE